MFNFNFNQNNNKKGGIVSDSLDNYYKKAKENIKRANILFPTMKDMKDDLEDEVNEWERNHSFVPKTNQDKTTGISGAIKIPNDETEEERTMRLANSLYPTMRDKEEKEQGKSSLGEYTDLEGSELFALLKTPSKSKENKEAQNNTFDKKDSNKVKEKITGAEEPFKKKTSKEEGKPLVLKGAVSETVYNENKQDDKSIESVNENKNKNWSVPLDSGYLSSPYGKRVSPMSGASSDHNGIDIRVPVGTPVKSIADGKIIAVGPATGYGRWVVVDHGLINGKRVISEYGHISSSDMKIGQVVKQGDIIAKSGNEGKSTGPHLHLTIREGGFRGKAVSPEKYVDISRYSLNK